MQASLGSWLIGDPHFLRNEYINGKLCSVYEDSTGYQEWIWVKYKLPIQRRSYLYYDVQQITVLQKRIIEINSVIPDSIYEPPK